MLADNTTITVSSVLPCGCRIERSAEVKNFNVTKIANDLAYEVYQEAKNHAHAQPATENSDVVS